MAKNLKFISNSVHIGITDYGYTWKVGDEHLVDDKVADLAVKTFPTLFAIVETKKEVSKIKDVPKEKMFDKTDNKMFGKKKDK